MSTNLLHLRCQPYIARVLKRNVECVETKVIKRRSVGRLLDIQVSILDLKSSLRNRGRKASKNQKAKDNLKIKLQQQCKLMCNLSLILVKVKEVMVAQLLKLISPTTVNNIKLILILTRNWITLLQVMFFAHVHHLGKMSG